MAEFTDYKIVNPAAGDDYFDAGSNAYDDAATFSPTSTQPIISSGVMTGLGGTKSSFSNKEHGVTLTVFGSTVIVNLTHTRESLSGASNFATMTEGAYIIRRVTDTLAGDQANTLLRSGGHTNPGIIQSVHKVRTAFRYSGAGAGVRAGNWDIFNAVFNPALTGSNASIGDVGGNVVTTGSADHATPNDADPVGRTIPGELVYKEPRPIPFQADYSSKTS